MYSLNRKLIEKTPNIQLRGFQVGVVGPDPISHWSYRFPIQKGDVESGKRFIEEFKRFMEGQEHYWANRYMKKKQPRSISVKYAVIEHYGRPPRVELYVRVILAPKVFINEVQNAKNKIYNYLRRYGLVLPSRPQSIYIISERRVRDLSRIYNNANRSIDKVNRDYEKFYNYVKPIINDMIDKYGLGKTVKLEVMPVLHKINVTLTPINIGKSDINRWIDRDPYVAEMLYNSLRRYVELVVEDIKRRIRPVLESMYSSKITVSDMLSKIREVEEITKELGLGEVTEMYVTTLKEELMKLTRTEKVNINEVLDNISERVLSAWVEE